MNSSVPNNGGLSDKSLFSPTSVASDGTQLYVVDQGNRRILVWDTIPTANFTPADRVVCKPDFESSRNVGGPSASACTPYGVTISGSKMFVAARDENRVLIWNSLPNADGTPADVVIGQPTMDSTSNNRAGAYAQNTMSAPTHVETNGTVLAVTETGARVRFWNAIPTAVNSTSDFILGQTGHTTNTTGTTSSTFNDVRQVLFAAGEFFATDALNHRILKWLGIPSTTAQAANAVWGQPNFTTNSTPSLSWTSENNPSQIDYDSNTGALLIGSENTNRIILIEK
jgi:hypothetical protein